MLSRKRAPWTLSLNSRSWSFSQKPRSPQIELWDVIGFLEPPLILKLPQTYSKTLSNGVSSTKSTHDIRGRPWQRANGVLIPAGARVARRSLIIIHDTLSYVWNVIGYLEPPLIVKLPQTYSKMLSNGVPSTKSTHDLRGFRPRDKGEMGNPWAPGWPVWALLSFMIHCVRFADRN